MFLDAERRNCKPKWLLTKVGRSKLGNSANSVLLFEKFSQVIPILAKRNH